MKNEIERESKYGHDVMGSEKIEAIEWINHRDVTCLWET